MPVAYAIAPVAVLVGVALQYLLLPRPAAAPFLLFIPCVAAASWLAGRGPGLLSVGLSALVGNYLFVVPSMAWWSRSAPALGGTALFLGASAVVALLCSSIREGFLERERAQQASQRNAAELEAVFSAISDSVMVIDRSGRIVRANAAARALYGSDPIGTDLKTLANHFSARRPDGRPIAGDELPTARALQGRRVDRERLLLKPAGNDPALVVESGSAPLRLRGQPLGAVTVWHDISELIRAQEALVEAARRKDEFLAVLSHELRNPLSPIRNSLYILDHAEPGGEQALRAKKVIDRQVAHLNRLIADLLDVTRISSGRVQLQREPLDLGELVRRTVEDYQSVFAKSEVELELALAGRTLWVDGDGTRLSQVVGNLLSNAAKFTAPGGHTTVTVEKDEQANGAIIRIRDTGVGVTPEMLPRLFEPFAQADRSLDRSRGGLGLGLALVKSLVELHGGRVEARSAGPGRGAEFSVWLPLQEKTSVARPAVATGGTRRRVLVIEDNQDAAQSLRETLELDEHQVEVAFDGPEGLEKARRFKPEVVLCDIGLPGMDGYQVARAFRADPAFRSVHLVALTGYALPDDVAKAKDAGFDRHLAKPASIEGLGRAVAGAGSNLH